MLILPERLQFSPLPVDREGHEGVRRSKINIYHLRDGVICDVIQQNSRVDGATINLKSSVYVAVFNQGDEENVLRQYNVL